MGLLGRHRKSFKLLGILLVGIPGAAEAWTGLFIKEPLIPYLIEKAGGVDMSDNIWLVALPFVLMALGVLLLFLIWREEKITKAEDGIERVVDELKAIRIIDGRSGNITRILYALSGKLRVRLPAEAVSVQDELVLGQLNLRKIVQLEHGYWTLTELGKEVILYLEKNKQILKEGKQMSTREGEEAERTLIEKLRIKQDIDGAEKAKGLEVVDQDVELRDVHVDMKVKNVGEVTGASFKQTNKPALTCWLIICECGHRHNYAFSGTPPDTVKCPNCGRERKMR